MSTTTTEKPRRSTKPTNGHGTHVEPDRRQLRRELIEAAELFQTLRGLAIPPSNGGLPALPSERLLTGRTIAMVEVDLVEAMKAYLGERLETSETLKMQEAKTDLVVRFVEFLRASSWLRHLGDRDYHAKDIARDFVSQDGG
jgi:hypothetical protein